MSERPSRSPEELVGGILDEARGMPVREMEAVLLAVCGAVRDEGGDRVARVIAYGSRVTGTPRPDSDLDLMIVVFDEPAPELRSELRRAAGEAAPWPVSVLVVSERRFEETKEIPDGLPSAPEPRTRDGGGVAG